MPVDYEQEYLSRIRERDQQKQALADQNRQRLMQNAAAVQKNIDLNIAHYLDPNNPGQPLQGKEQVVAELRKHRATMEQYINNLSHPNFNPESGKVEEPALRKITDKLHITKEPVQNRTAGQQMQDIAGIREKYATEPSLLSPDEQKQAARINAKLEPGAAPDKPDPESWKVVSGKLKDGREVTLQHNEKSGEFRDLANKPISPDMLEGFTPAPKTTKTKSKYDQQREDYAESIGKTPDQLTFADDVKMMDTLSHADQRMAMLQRRVKLAEDTFALNQARNDFSQFAAIQKQLTPVEKVQTAAANADFDVSNPSGPGDVELVFAFIEATKPTSGFRFTDTERRWIVGTRGIIEGAETRINQGFTGETLSPDQRQNMSAIIKHAAGQAEQTANKFLQGAAQFSPRAAGAAKGQISGQQDVSDDDFLKKF